MKIKKIISTILVLCMASGVIGCSSKEGDESAVEVKTVTVLAAASLTDVMGELETKYEASHKDVDLVFSFAGSGALQTQIEEGAPCDIFISAATKQMNALRDEDLMDDNSIFDLLENKVVLIVPGSSSLGLTSFEDVTRDDVKMIGLGEPESVPAGKYAEQIFTSLGILDDVKAKANYGSDVRTVLSWVEMGELDCGVVYATDAFTSDSVKIVAEAPEGSCDKVIYPAGIVKSSEVKPQAEEFLKYLQSDDAAAVFEAYGFTMAG